MPRKTRMYLPTSVNQDLDYDRFGKSKESDPIDSEIMQRPHDNWNFMRESERGRKP